MNRKKSGNTLTRIRKNKMFHHMLKKRVDAGETIDVILLEDKFCLPKGARLRILAMYEEPGFSAVVQLLDHWRDLFKWYDRPVNSLGDRRCSTTWEVMYKRAPGEFITNFYFSGKDKIFEVINEGRNGLIREYAEDNTDKDYMTWLEDQVFESKPSSKYLDMINLKKAPRQKYVNWINSMLETTPERRLERLEEAHIEVCSLGKALDDGFKLAVEKMIELELQIEELSRKYKWVREQNERLDKMVVALEGQVDGLNE